MTDYGLSSQQLEVICALSNGATTAAAAEQAGVHRNTINNWRRNLPPFQHALASAQYDRALFFREQLEERIDVAFKTLDDILTDPKTPASIRLKAALAIINAAITPPEPKKQLELDIEKLVVIPSQPQTAPTVHNNAQPAPDISVTLRPFAADSPNPPVVHNSAQPIHPENKTGRNESCPCGSGKKYKRCCLNKPAGQESLHLDTAA